MRKIAILLLVSALVSAVVCAQQLLVFPAVTDELPGENDSLWVTVVRIVKVDPRDTVTIRRRWLCLPGGGSVDDPSPFTWVLEGGSVSDRFVSAWGDSLLGDSGSRVGAVALEIDGGEVLAHAYVVDVLRGFHLPYAYSAGNGQLIPALSAPLTGTSHIPWLPGCRNVPCSVDPPEDWDFLRDNIGLLNPNPEPLVITGSLVAFSHFPGYGYIEISDPDTQAPETLTRELPPFGWVQFHWQAGDTYGEAGFPPMPLSASGGFILNLTPDKDLPYYAYASVVFSPDPESGIPAFSDPMYVPAEPGYVPAMTEVPKASGSDSVSDR